MTAITTQTAYVKPLPGEYPYRGQLAYEGARVHALTEDKKAPHHFNPPVTLTLVAGPVTCLQCRKMAGPFYEDELPDLVPPAVPRRAEGVSITTLEQDLEQALEELTALREKDLQAKRNMGGLIGQQKREISKLRERLRETDRLKTDIGLLRTELDTMTTDRNTLELLVAVVLFKHGAELDADTRYVDVSSLEYRAARELMKSFERTRLSAGTVRLSVAFRP